MGFFSPTPPDYDPLVWQTLPFPERARQVCRSWAVQGYGTPPAIFIVYALKVVFYVWAWTFFCSFSPSLGGLETIESWWLEPLAFQKAILWSLLFEVLGLGCGSGPLTGRYLPPVAAPLYFLRPGTIRLPPFALPGLRGHRRTWLDVALYAALLVTTMRALFALTLGIELLLPIVVVAAALALRDKTVFLAARGEHYLLMVLVFVLAGSEAELVAASKGVLAALWFFAGVSKLNHHFPAVVGVMLSNSPVMRFQAARRRLYRDFPRDLRPSRLAGWLGHFGTALELGVPIVLLLAGDGPLLIVGMVLMLALHGFITSNVPMGVPIEWNVVVVYSAFVLFWGQPTTGLVEMGPILGVILLFCVVAVPIAGNLWPGRISFLPAMRYYAGNWAMSVWLFRDGAEQRLKERLIMSVPLLDDQLAPFYDEATRVGLVGKVMAFRLMHLHGRAIGALLPELIDAPLADYTWLDGELVAGLALGWNFGDGHLHDERLLAAVQAECDFEPGQLRCIFVESQPMFGRALRYRLHDAHAGQIAEGELAVAELRRRQPWDHGAGTPGASRTTG